MADDGAQARRPPSLAGKAAIITGASRGIGAAAARRFADAGAEVVLAARDAAALQRVADEIGDSGGRAIAVPTDVTDPHAVEELVDRAVDVFGRLDVALNNAGGGFAGKAPLADGRVEDFREMLDLNLLGAFLCMKFEIPAMLDSGGGAIVNVSSGSGFSAAPGMAPYVAAKHGLHGLTKVAALDYAERGVRVNAVAPGPILAGPLADLDDEFREMAAASVPMRRIGSPDEVIAAVLWLCSDEAAFVTGSTVPVDGGQLAGRA